MKAGFIGLGNLGRTMALRLMSQGVSLLVWNRTRQRAEGLGAEIAASPAALVSGVDIVFLNLFDSDAVLSVITGRQGLVKGNCRGKIIVDTTTNHFEKVGRFYETMQKQGGYYLESPVLGSVGPASQGTLTVLVSGNKEAFETARPFIEKFGKHIFFLEKAGLASRMKLVNNLLLGAFMATIAESVALAEAAGVDKAQALDIFAAGAGNSGVLNAKREKIIKEDFSPHFSSSLIYKDLHYLQDLCRTLNRPLLTGSIVKEIFGMTFPRKMEQLDFSAVYQLFKT